MGGGQFWLTTKVGDVTKRGFISGIVLFVVILAVAGCTDSGEKTDSGKKEGSAALPPATAKTALTDLKVTMSNQVASRALEEARKLVGEYPGTPEADSAAAMKPDLKAKAAFSNLKGTAYYPEMASSALEKRVSSLRSIQGRPKQILRRQ